MGLRFYTTYELASEPATVSWRLAGDTRHLLRDRTVLTAMA